jgi:hypothetical protein
MELARAGYCESLPGWNIITWGNRYVARLERGLPGAGAVLEETKRYGKLSKRALKRIKDVELNARYQFSSYNQHGNIVKLIGAGRMRF